MFLPKKFIIIKGIEFEIPKSTTKLSIGEGIEYTDKIRNFASQELKANIPTPEEAGFISNKGHQTKETKLEYPTDYNSEEIKF